MLQIYIIKQLWVSIQLMGRYFPARIRTIVRVRIMGVETSALQVEGNDNDGKLQSWFVLQEYS